MVEWHSLSGKEVLERFKSSETGLSNEEAEKRIEQQSLKLLDKSEIRNYGS